MKDEVTELKQGMKKLKGKLALSKNIVRLTRQHGETVLS